MNEKVKKLEAKEKEDRNKYSASLTLKDNILEAESIAITNIIETINMHARTFLDCFFEANPISVQLQSFKETKKSTKPCININIEYKGMECDLTMMSGGELARVVLAYTLALSEIFNTPLLLLDECTASLDQDLTSDVFEGIREHFGGKLVLIIAHQVVSGTFDKIIKL
jgi:DNA repair exonuclease SbcCD ATPase subunit